MVKVYIGKSFGSIGLTDIIKGSSINCTWLDAHSGLTGLVVRGWEATKGSDPVTGLGNRDLEVLVVAEKASYASASAALEK